MRSRRWDVCEAVVSQERGAVRRGLSKGSTSDRAYSGSEGSGKSPVDEPRELDRSAGASGAAERLRLLARRAKASSKVVHRSQRAGRSVSRRFALLREHLLLTTADIRVLRCRPPSPNLPAPAILAPTPTQLRLNRGRSGLSVANHSRTAPSRQRPLYRRSDNRASFSQPYLRHLIHDMGLFEAPDVNNFLDALLLPLPPGVNPYDVIDAALNGIQRDMPISVGVELSCLSAIFAV